MKLLDEIKQGESKTLEFKERLPKNDSIAKTIIAFANTNGGKLVLGINDKRDVIGIDNTKLFDLQDKIACIVADNCHPILMPNIYSVNIHNKLVLVIEVTRGNLKPYFLKNYGKASGTYIRLGATNRLADSETIAELERQKLHISFDEEICLETEFQELNCKSLFDKFAAIGKSLNNEKLKNLKLVKAINGKLYPTNGLLIILGLQDHCTLKCARFKGNTMDVFIDKKEYSGDIFSILENAQNFVLNHINLSAEITGLYRTDRYELPVVALREALVNALIHRDYVNRGRDIKVGVYDDIVNIVSPGGLPSGINIDDALNGRSLARNRVVANVFKELGLIEQWGSGIHRIINSCKDHGLLKPVIQEKNDFFDIELIRPRLELKEPSENRRKTVGKPSENTNITVGKLSEYSNQEELVVHYLKTHKTAKSKHIENLLQIKESRTRELLREMVKKKVIEKHGIGKSTFYSL